MRNGDVLVHHPYDSFANSVELFVEQAASDPNVLAIKQTLYRTGGDEAGIVASLVKAAEAGKQVVALVELKARFDEQANIERARMLEQAGAHVVYGLVGLKTHAKILLVVRQEPDGIRRYCHVGTGNYNPKTATTYEDLGVLSCDPDLGADLSELFNHLTGYSRPGEYRRLLVAPMHLRDELRRLIRSQAHAGGMITIKMNALVDPEMIDELYAASEAGARVSTSSCAASAACAPACRACRRTSPCARSSAATSSTRGSSASAFRATPTPSTSSDRPTSCRATSTGGSRRPACHRPAHARPPRRDPRRSTSPTTCSRGRSSPTARGARCRPSPGVDSQVRFQELALARAEDRTRGRLTMAKHPPSVAKVVRTRARRRPRRSSRLTSRACSTGADPESVHQARVATRRLRSDLRTFEPFLDEKWAPSLRGELRWLASELGAVRDVEVMRDRLRGHAALLAPTDADTVGHVLRRLDADREAARTALLASMCSTRYTQLRAALAEAAKRPRSRSSSRRAPDRGAPPSRAQPLEEAASRAVDELGHDTARRSLHGVRIRAKQCRYAAEACVPALGKPARRFAKAMAQVQDVLGEHHDAVVAGAWLAKTAQECSPGRGVRARPARGDRTRRARRIARAPSSARVWRRARRKRLRAWHLEATSSRPRAAS